jgi:hypothetical protein
MRVRLTREEFVEGLLKGVEDSTLTTPIQLAAFVAGFAAAHFVNEDQSLDAWMSLCHKAYEEARARGIKLGLVGASN